MPKKLVLCLDGTNNCFGTRNTNVVRFHQLLDRRANSGQVLYYDAGVGTLPEQGVTMALGRMLSVGLQLAFGRGLETNVEEAYSFIADHHEEGDSIYLLGFSRGAYAARVLAALLHQLGLVMPSSSRMVPHSLRILRSLRAGNLNRYEELCREFRDTFARRGPGFPEGRCPVRWLGLWDTVASVGFVWNPRTYPFTRHNSSVHVIRHAVAIDERRTFYRQNLWEHPKAGGTQEVEECWFPGVHSDVGGGYAESESRLWVEPLRWMVDGARSAGLAFDEMRVRERLGSPSDRNWATQMHNSLTSGWIVLELFPKLAYSHKTRRHRLAVNLGRRRVIPSGARFHESYWLRRADPDCGYEPPNAPAPDPAP